ncbi:unnamed protein product [Heterobilharzia americana]|nr:unnamed protein product [Heterobilharzia americana]
MFIRRVCKGDCMRNRFNQGLKAVLVQHGCDVNQFDSMNCLPIHHAARNGHTATVEWLMKNGANLLQYNLFGQKPADLAMANHFPELADIIGRQTKKQVKALESKTLRASNSIESRPDNA